MTLVTRTVRLAPLIAAFACSGKPAGPPDILGIPFGAPTADLAPYLPDAAKRESYPLIPLYGFKLAYPNPDNWTVIVQDTSEDLLRNQVFAIHLGRDRAQGCGRSDMDTLATNLISRQFRGFDETIKRVDPADSTVLITGVSPRRLLAARLSCFIGALGVQFTYIDRDVFRYRDTSEVAHALRAAMREAQAFRSRTLR